MLQVMEQYFDLDISIQIPHFISSDISYVENFILTTKYYYTKCYWSNYLCLSPVYYATAQTSGQN